MHSNSLRDASHRRGTDRLWCHYRHGRGVQPGPAPDSAIPVWLSVLAVSVSMSSRPPNSVVPARSLPSTECRRRKPSLIDFGATDFILADAGVDVINEVKKMTGGGVDHTFEVVGSTKLLTDCLQMTRPGGNICAVGVPDLTAEVTYPFQALHQNKNLLGIRAGGARPRKDFPMLANLYLKGQLKLDQLISNTAGLDGLQGAFDAIKTGTEARTVLLPNG